MNSDGDKVYMRVIEKKYKREIYNIIVHGFFSFKIVLIPKN
jgi:hypothetical protein